MSIIASFFDWLAAKGRNEALAITAKPESHRYCITLSSVVRDNWVDLQKFTKTRHFARNESIYLMGDPATSVYLITSGGVRVLRFSQQGREKTMWRYEKGDFFGEVCICGAAHREEEAQAMEPTIVVAFDTMELLKMLRKHGDLLFELLMVVCARLSESQDQIARLAFDDVRGRLAKELLALDHVANREAPGETQPVNLTHQELARLVGSTRENVTGILIEFRRLGMVDYRTGRIFVFADRVKAYLKNNGYEA